MQARVSKGVSSGALRDSSEARCRPGCAARLPSEFRRASFCWWASPSAYRPGGWIVLPPTLSGHPVKDRLHPLSVPAGSLKLDDPNGGEYRHDVRGSYLIHRLFAYNRIGIRFQRAAPLGGVLSVAPSGTSEFDDLCGGLRKRRLVRPSRFHTNSTPLRNGVPTLTDGLSIGKSQFSCCGQWTLSPPQTLC